MAKVQFTYQEVIAALPCESKFTEDGLKRDPNTAGSAGAWQIYTSKPNADEAAGEINNALVVALTEGVEVDFQNLTDDYDGFAATLSSIASKALRENFGDERFGFHDTEPRVAMHYFVKRLFGDDSRY